MNKNIKTGILAAVLVLPVFLLIFLYKFGNNQYEIPVYHVYDSALVDGKYVITDVHTVPDFKFIDEDGKPFSGSDLKGKIYVADFFFSRCQGICKVTSPQLARVQEEYKENDQIKIVSFTVDPANDSPEVLKEFAKSYRAIPGKWKFLTGNKDSLHTLSQTGFFMTARDSEDSKEEFDHSGHFVLVDKEGRIRGYYSGLEKKEVDRLITEISILLHEYGDQ